MRDQKMQRKQTPYLNITSWHVFGKEMYPSTAHALF